MASTNTRRMRCAVYTRKSTEEGLDKAFNSLDAQREACAAYVMSQQHEGWTLLPDLYDDGGYSGGSMERPALQQLLADVKAGKVDVVVVYKIDRLTRSLADFAKIVDVLDAGEASFVSVTQAFSTTTSMGRLTLNVLLSFAQFEREVIAERIRDKVAASKAKGMWMGGGVPLGYEVKDRKLVIVPDEAATVRDIMERYLATDSIRTLVEELHHDGIVTKHRVSRNGRTSGGVPFKRGALAWLLSNRIYVGKVVHKGTVYPGEHEAIVSDELFDAVQAKLTERTMSDSRIERRKISLLAGMIRDNRGRAMSPCHTRNHGRSYSYYASSMNDDASSPALRLPAGELEASVRTAIAGWLQNNDQLRDLAGGFGAGELTALFGCCSALAERINNGSIAEVRSVFHQLKVKVSVSSEDARASFSTSALGIAAELEGIEDRTIEIIIPTHQASYGHEPRLRLEPTGNASTGKDERLVELLARAFAAREQLLQKDQSETDAMPIEKLCHIQRVARISYLDPTIVRSILNGSQPKHLGARDLWRMGDMPLSWAEQRKALHISSN